jgi:hypothetical protein
MHGKLVHVGARGWVKSASIVAAVALGLALGCSSSSGGGASCSSKGLCPNDTPPTPSDISQCQSLIGDSKCGGLFRAYFDCAYAQQKCASDGTLDGPTTQDAITANCAQQIASYQSCSGTTSTTPTCGYDELPCCTSGPACASTACCDPATNECVGPGSACTTTDTVCVSSTCEACGAAGQTCCPTFGMPNPDPCPAGGCCHYTQPGGGVCIAEGGQCDVPDDGGAAVICHAGSCTACGSMGGPCCANATCTESGTLCAGGTCVDCNGSGQPPCQ